MLPSFEKAETELQKQLTKLCDRNGRETNPRQSAFLFNELGLLYKSKSPDKISLIQSAALLNAAIVRQPDNYKFQEDLQELCKHVLDCANAKQRGVSLIEISRTAVHLIQEMRSNAKSHLNGIMPFSEIENDDEKMAKEKIYVQQVKSLQTNISFDYKQIMVFISQECIEIMGQPPCKYALVGMGSLAREEVSPYSDFEHIVVLNNFLETQSQQDKEIIKEYFRWYSVIFHIVVVNLQETDLYSMCIPCLNDHSKPGGNWFRDIHTPQGISFDGMMPHACHFPLGKTQPNKKQPWTTELIKPVDEMVQFLEVKDIKKGYKLGDLLTRTCFIDGDEIVYQQFKEGVEISLKENAAEHKSIILAQLEEDLINFSLTYNLKVFTFDRKVNIKQIVYRSITLFISALGRFYDLDQRSCFEVIDELQRMRKISIFTAHKFSLSVAVACHIRLFHYMSKKRQDDDIYKESVLGSEKLKEMTKVVNKHMLVECLQTADILQLILKNKEYLMLFDHHWKKSPTFQMAILNQLGLYHETIELGENLVFHENDSEMLHHFGAAYIRLKQFHNCLKTHERIKSLVDINDKNHKIAYNELFCYYSLGQTNLVRLKTDALLKMDLTEDVWHGFLILNAQCNLEASEYRQCLRAVREWRKKFSKDDVKINMTSYQKTFLQIMFIVTTALVGLSRVEQSFHWALEGRNLLDLIDAIDYYYLFDDTISFHRLQPTVEVFDYKERPTPIHTMSFISTSGQRCLCFKLDLPGDFER